MISGWKVDTRCRGGGFWVVGLLVNLRLFFSLSAVTPLTIKLDGFILPGLERGGDWVHRVDSFFDSLDEPLFEHFVERDVVVTTESLIFLEVLNVLFSSVEDHGDIFELSTGGSSWVRVAEVGWKLVDKVLEVEEGSKGDIS